jgi:RES domain-containing protein
MAREPLQTITIKTLAYRYSNYDTPFWARGNTKPGRWNVPGDGPTQYLSLSTDGAWAELIRAEALSTEDEVAQISMTIWQAEVEQAAVVDYSEFSGAEAAGFPAEALVDDDYSRCQREGRRLRERGYMGVIAPSAALPGTLNLTLFGGRIAVDWNSTPHLASSISAAVLTKGAPPPGLLPRVRHYGTRHAGFQAYARAIARRKGRKP